MQAWETRRNTGNPSGDRGRDQLATRERQAGPCGVAERPTVPLKLVNTSGGKRPQLKTNARSAVLSGPAREGLALLQGLLLCGHCGRAITVRYTGNGGIYPMYLCNWLHREGLATKDCL